MINYIPDTNVFQLAGPPTWFLKRLWDFDASLVIVPSRQSCLYRLAQRRRPQLSSNIVNDTLFKDSDTRMLANYSLVPVTSILPTINWSNPYLFEELRRRNPWMMGGAEKVNQMLEEQDAEQEAEKTAKNDHLLDDVAKDSWRYYNKLIGVRSHLYSPTAKRPSLRSRAI